MAAVNGVTTFNNLVFNTAGIYTLTASTTGLSSAVSGSVAIVATNTPTILSISPSAGLVGSTVTVTITGQFTHFVQGTTTANFGSGITVQSLTVSSSTSAIAILSLDTSASAGTRSITLTTGTENATLFNAFTVVTAVGQPASLTLVLSNSLVAPDGSVTATVTALDDFLGGLPIGLRRKLPEENGSGVESPKPFVIN